MALVYYMMSTGELRPRLTACPACGKELTGQGGARRSHLETHQPEDFGLSPMGRTYEGP